MVKKFRLERNGRRSFDTAVEYPTVEPNTRPSVRKPHTATPAVWGYTLCLFDMLLSDKVPAGGPYHEHAH